MGKTGKVSGVVTCTKCDTILDESTSQDERPPCPTCGSTRRTFAMSGTVRQTLSVSADHSVVAANDTLARKRRLAAAIRSIDEAMQTNDAGACQDASMTVLHIVHALEDDRLERKTWSHDSWTSDEVDQWESLIAVRNAGHHRAIPITVLTSRPGRLVWEADVAGNRSRVGREKYVTSLHGLSVLDTLRAAESWVAR